MRCSRSISATINAQGVLMGSVVLDVVGLASGANVAATKVPAKTQGLVWR